MKSQWEMLADVVKLLHDRRFIDELAKVVVTLPDDADEDYMDDFDGHYDAISAMITTITGVPYANMFCPIIDMNDELVWLLFIDQPGNAYVGDEEDYLVVTLTIDGDDEIFCKSIMFDPVATTVTRCAATLIEHSRFPN